MKTLSITTPIGQTFLRSVLYLSLFCATLELFARTPAARAWFPRESYGTSHPHFELQLVRLRERVARGDSVDCIFIGNSQVLYGIDPQVVDAAYREASGREIHCQNFGLGGLTPRTTGPLVRVLIENFHPSLIVFETGILDYSSSSMEGTDASIMSSPWMKYQLGEFSIDGWLYQNSSGFRRIFGLDRTLKYIEEKKTLIEADGYASLTGQTGTPLQDQIEFFENNLANLEITQPQVDGLQALLALNPSQVQVVVIETPIHPVFYAAKRKVRALQPEFESMLTARAAENGVALWLTRDSLNLPEPQWHDLAHLNTEGSAYFSRQIGLFLASVYPPAP